MKKQYLDQVSLLLDVLPIVFEEKSFVLKGGTAINLFEQPFPRLSVDIDVTYLPIEDRSATINNIEGCLKRIEEKIQNRFKSVITKPHYNKKTKSITRLDLLKDTTLVKIEPNLVLRSTVFEPRLMDLAKGVEDLFGKTALNIPIASMADLYGGKICAALDRQHPRDLFDIHVLFRDGAITSEMKQAFIVYLCSHNRPMSELLNPNLLDQNTAYSDEFAGMTNIEVSYETLEETRLKLINTIQNILTDQDKQFLLSFKQGKPDWTLIDLPNMDHLPGIKWKQMNIAKMDSSKHQMALDKLESLLYG